MAKRAVPGWLYILSSPAMPGLLKIGHTTRDPAIRAIELADATGVPCAFTSEFTQAVDNSEAMEGHLHKLLAHCRPTPNREFFFISVPDAKAAIAALMDGKRAKGEASAFTGTLPPGWRSPVAPARRLQSDRLGQIQDAPKAAVAVDGDDLVQFAAAGAVPLRVVARPPRRPFPAPVRRRRKDRFLRWAAASVVVALLAANYVPRDAKSFWIAVYADILTSV